MPGSSDAELREHVATLAGVVDDLRRRLDQAETERAELRRLLAAALSRVPELPPASTETERSDGTRDERSPAYRPPWWRRLLGWAT
jgi:hypothetical protein